VNERSEAAAQKITEIKNNTQAAIAKLVSLKNSAHRFKELYQKRCSKIDLFIENRFPLRPLRSYGQFVHFLVLTYPSTLPHFFFVLGKKFIFQISLRLVGG
jgi:hypothetical protein